MRIKTLLRTSSALPAFPLGVGLVILYYTSDTSRLIAFFPIPYAPLLVERPLEPMYAVTYALVSAAAAWQGARLKESGVWDAPPYRRAWQIIASALAPIVGLGWLMFIVPVGMAFIQSPTLPTLVALPPLLLGMALAVAHALIGFTIGQRVRPLIAVPVLMSVVFVIVSFSQSVEPLYLSHMMGNYAGMLGFGETATLASIAANFLPTAGLGLAVALMWLNARVVFKVGLACVVVAASVFTSYSIAKDWKAFPSVNVATEKVCRGNEPRVCMPEQISGDIGAVRAEMKKTYTMLETYGIIEHPPATVNDQLMYGRFTQKPTESTRYLPLAVAHRDRHLVADVVEDSVRFPCDIPTAGAERTVSFWLSLKLGGNPDYAKVAEQDPYYTREQHEKIMKEVHRVSALPAGKQKTWYRTTTKKACEGRP
ncbi:hypothetical protein [Streptomyces sp. NBC_00209]|uniref:DUF7224 domain-containing protein n=1 Tax=Streptomyces sp. NBC_00209 TaxID=2975682 RepID=UPI0032568208